MKRTKKFSVKLFLNIKGSKRKMQKKKLQRQRKAKEKPKLVVCLNLQKSPEKNMRRKAKKSKEK